MYKKAPKAEDNSNKTTHYLRAFKNNSDRYLHETHKTDAKYVLEVSSDDKAYVQPGTSTGFRGARKQKVYQPVDKKHARSLPKYDFPTYMVNITPGTYRYLAKDFKEIEEVRTKYFTSDSTYVFSRPKYFVGSSGLVWASEAMLLRWEIPHKYFLSVDNCEDPSLMSILILLRDASVFYYDSTNELDLKKLSSSKTCMNRKYEKARLRVVFLAMMQAFALGDRLIEASVQAYIELKVMLAKLQTLLLECKASLDDGSVKDSVQLVNKVKDMRRILLEHIGPSLPVMKSRFIESTDGGPGVSHKQNGVKLTIMQRIRICNLDYYIRYHLANGDSRYNEVERCQSYVGDALCDGGTIEWEDRKLFVENSMEKLSEMTLEEITAAEDHYYRWRCCS